MNGPGTEPRAMETLVTIMLQEMRRAEAQLRDRGVPALPAARRLFARDTAWRLARRERPSEALLRDLDALAGMLDREAAHGTHHGWRSDEGDVHGSRMTVHRTDDAEALHVSARGLRSLMRAIEQVLDAAAAVDLAETLVTG